MESNVTGIRSVSYTHLDVYKRQEKGYEVGLISQERYDRLKEKERLIESEIERLKNAYVGTSEKVQELLESYEMCIRDRLYPCIEWYIG